MAGDRRYEVTVQRVFDRLSGFEKLKMLMILMWEVVTMSMFKLKEYIAKTENDDVSQTNCKCIPYSRIKKKAWTK